MGIFRRRIQELPYNIQNGIARLGLPAETTNIGVEPSYFEAHRRNIACLTDAMLSNLGGITEETRAAAFIAAYTHDDGKLQDSLIELLSRKYNNREERMANKRHPLYGASATLDLLFTNGFLEEKIQIGSLRDFLIAFPDNYNRIGERALIPLIQLAHGCKDIIYKARNMNEKYIQIINAIRMSDLLAAKALDRRPWFEQEVLSERARNTYNSALNEGISSSTIYLFIEQLDFFFSIPRSEIVPSNRSYR